MQVQRLEGPRVVSTDHWSQEWLLLLELQLLHLRLKVIEHWHTRGLALPWWLQLLPKTALNMLTAAIEHLLLQNLQRLYFLQVLVDPVLSTLENGLLL